MQRSVVVLPHPLGPRRTTNSLSRISRSSPLTATAPSYDLESRCSLTRAKVTSDGEERINNLRLPLAVAALEMTASMEEIRVAEKRLSDYRAIIGGPAFAEILALASKLKGKRVAHVNATGYGGGVAELLHSLVPLQRDVGLDVPWFVLGGSTAFFTATKTMHNALQGSDVGLTPDMQANYRHFNELNAADFKDEYDYVIIHDPQPAPFATLCERKGKSIWRCHIDLTSPNKSVLLLASMARDDPVGWLWFERSARHAGDDPDIHFLTDLRGVGALEVNVLQRQTDVAIAKSLREGFGLIVSESLWKSVPVVGGDVTGIRIQIKDGRHGYLVSRVSDCSGRTIKLLRSPAKRKTMWKAGRDRVRRHFLITRYLREYLRIFSDLKAAG